ncbi:hypothetical protein VTO73DRAFT_3559 [Trametes versicolor]
MAPSIAPISIRLYHNILVSGCPVEGEIELNFRGIQEDGIEEVHVKLRGIVRTSVHRNKSTQIETLHIVRDDASLWCRGGAYPPPGSDVLRIPFRLQLPPYIPPSFQHSERAREGSVRYSVTAVGVRPGIFQFNRRICVPMAVVPFDAAGVAVRESLTATVASGAEVDWKMAWREVKIRRGLWGDKSTVDVQLLLPNIAIFPLFTPIPFIIKVKTVSAPITHEKANALPADKPAFPPVPETYEQVTFKLHSHMRISVRSMYTDHASADVAVFARAASSQFLTDVPPREWVPLDRPGEKGTEPGEAMGMWVQHATFKSSFSLACPPTFVVESLQCEYMLQLKVPFPGIGNNVNIAVPVVISSGLNAPIAPGSGDASRPTVPLGLPPAYWDANDHQWSDDTKA